MIATLPAVDIEKAKRFYGETLGLPDVDIPVPEDSVLLEGGGANVLRINGRSDAGMTESTGAGCIVAYVERAMGELSQSGVEFEPYDMPGLKTAEHGIAEVDGATSVRFRDSEGHILAIFEMLT